MRRVNDREITVEARADGGRMIVGYGAVFYRADDPGTEYELFDNFFERVDPTAFDRVISEGQEVRGLFNHSPDHLLGRVPKTMRLKTDKVGLRYEIDLPDTTLGRDLLVSIERGDLKGSSFSFDVVGQRFEKEDGREIRTLTDVNMFDVGPVTFPAYEATSAEVRSSAAKEIEKLRTQHEYRTRVEKRLATLTE